MLGPVTSTNCTVALLSELEFKHQVITVGGGGGGGGAGERERERTAGSERQRQVVMFLIEHDRLCRNTGVDQSRQVREESDFPAADYRTKIVLASRAFPTSQVPCDRNISRNIVTVC